MGKSFSKLTPRIATTLIISALKKYFTGHSEFPWTNDPATSNLAILSDYPEDNQQEVKVPTLVVQGGDVAFNQDGIGNMQHLLPWQERNTSGDIITKYAFIEEWLQFTLQSTVQIHCLTNSRDSADELGFEVGIFMVHLKHQLGDILQLQYLSMPQQTAPHVIAREGWTGTWDSTVALQYTFTLRRKHQPVDLGEPLRSIETTLDPVHPKGTPPPSAGDKDHNGNPINTSDTGGTGTGGENGNWGGKGGVSTDETADCIDDGWITLRFRVRDDTVTGQQLLPGDTLDPEW